MRSFNSLQLKMRRPTVRANPIPKPSTNNNGDDDTDPADAIYHFTCGDSENVHPNSLGHTRGRVRPSKKSQAVKSSASELNPYKRTDGSNSNGVEGGEGREKEEKERTNKDMVPESLPQPVHVDDTYGRWVQQQCPAPLPLSTLSVFGTSDADTAADSHDTDGTDVAITSDIHTIVCETASIDMSDILFTCIQQQDFHRLASLLEYPDATACGTGCTMLELAEKGMLYCICYTVYVSMWSYFPYGINVACSFLGH